MTAFIAACLCISAVDPPFVPAPLDRSTMSLQVRRLYNKDVRADKRQLAEALEGIWKIIPEPGHRQADLARQLVPFLNLNSPKDDPREALVGRGTGQPIASMLVQIGLPAVPALLDQLSQHTDDTPEGREHRERAVRCMVEIYDEGGDGRRMTNERIKLYAEDWPPNARKQILSALDYTILQPSPPPVEGPGKR
jgi:hypothetical protein